MNMVANNAFILKEMTQKAEEKAIKLTKRVLKLSSQGMIVLEIAKECEISESKVEKILED